MYLSVLRSDEVKVERMENCIPNDLCIHTNFKSDLHLVSREQHCVVETLHSMPLSEMNMLHSHS